MFDVFKKYLSSQVILTEEEFKKIESVSMMKNLRKRQYLLHEGNVWQYRAFMCKGCTRIFNIAKDGSERIMRFSIENWWVGDLESYTTGEISKSNIDAIEDSQILLWKKDDFDTLLKEIPALKVWSEGLLIRSLNASQDRIYTILNYTAEEKYLHFIKNFPNVFNRVPMHMVASYLGISRETFSRIHSQAAHKSNPKT